MSDLTKESVAEATEWAERTPQYVITADDLVSRDMYHDADDVEKHVATLLALVRGMENALKDARQLLYTININEPYNQPDFDLTYEHVHETLALLPKED